MIDFAKEKAEKTKVLKKLLVKWFGMQETAKKAGLLLDKHPEIKISKATRSRKAS